MRETLVESYLTQQARKLGGDSHKIMAIEAGMPDRLVLLPGGLVYLVETKAPDGRLRPAQRVWHARALEKGTTVHVIWTKADVDTFLAQYARIA
jgi:hypothetical protein